MFEHMRNHRKLYRMLYEWLKPGGKFFMHIFVHQHTPYAFEVKDQDDWMSKFFFSGGMMPSDDLPLHFQEHLKLREKWCWDGTHYEKTANAWLENMDQAKLDIYPILQKTYGQYGDEVDMFLFDSPAMEKSAKFDWQILTKLKITKPFVSASKPIVCSTVRNRAGVV